MWSMIRLFVAIPLPENLRDRLQSLCHGVRDARWVSRDTMHLTLRFIGEVEEPLVDEICDALSEVRSEAFPLRLAGVGHFETGRKVRTLWAGVEKSPALLSLQERVESAVRRGGAAPDSRRFTAHVTLARLKPSPSHKVAGWVEANAMFGTEPFTVDRFVLYESFLSHSGAIHSPVETFALTAA
jgi:2'-5' RNA ligase